MSDAAQRAMASGEATNTLFMSPISAWEIGILVRKGRLLLSMGPDAWLDAFLVSSGAKLAPMPPRTLIAASFLPGDPPKDPADRIILATARAENLTIVTRDAEMLSYASAGHVRAVRC